MLNSALRTLYDDFFLLCYGVARKTIELLFWGIILYQNIGGKLLIYCLPTAPPPLSPFPLNSNACPPLILASNQNRSTPMDGEMGWSIIVPVSQQVCPNKI